MKFSQLYFTIYIVRTEAKKEVTKKSPSTSKKLTKSKSPEVKKATVKSESPENKPENGQKVDKCESPKKDEGNVLKIQSSDVIGGDFNPGKKNYDPIKDAFWEEGEK